MAHQDFRSVSLLFQMTDRHKNIYVKKSPILCMAIVKWLVIMLQKEYIKIENKLSYVQFI